MNSLTEDLKWARLGITVCTLLAVAGLPTPVQPEEKSGQVEERGIPGMPVEPLMGPTSRILPKLPAAAGQPPELQELQKSTPPPQAGQQPRPTVQELLDRFRTLPGGSEAIEDAKRRGARISMRAAAQPAFSVTVSPANWFVSDIAKLSLYGLVVWPTTAPNYWMPLTYSWSKLGFQVVNPVAILSVKVPTNGWYIVNCDAYLGFAVAILKHQVLTPTSGYTFPTIANWDYRSRSAARYSFPALVELSAGWHHFFWNTTVGNAYFYEFDVYSL